MKLDQDNNKPNWLIAIKWVSVSFIFVTVSTYLFILKFTPFIKIDDNGIELLNGAISIKDNKRDKNN